MITAPVIHIGGWPGSGKQTIGRLLAQSLSGRLIHNHLMLDAARAIYTRDTREGIAMREEVRSVILSHARRLPAEVPIVLTDALADEPASERLFQPTRDLARDRKAPLHIVVLEVALEENLRRLADPARHGGDKLTDPQVLRTLRKDMRLMLPDTAHVLDVTHLSADAAATQIRELVQS